MVFVEGDSFRDLRRLPTDAFRSIPRLPLEDVVLPVAASDLVAWYPFREGTGEDITAGDSNFGDTTDYSATVNGATFKPTAGATDIQTGQNSGAFELDGTDDTIDLGTVADSDQSLTFMTWVKPDTATKNFKRVLTKFDSSVGFEDGAVNFQIDNDEPRILVGNNGTFSQAIDTTGPVTKGTYIHLAGRLDIQNLEISLFVNGQLSDSTSIGQTAPLSSQPWRIGEDNPSSGSRFLNGTVDDTRIYTTALSDSQINQIYLNTQP